MVNLIKRVKEDYPSYKFYAVGSWVRRNPNFKDYDINIVPPRGKRSPTNIKEWSELLKRFDKKEFSGKKVDAQILPSMKKLLNMNAKEINKIIGMRDPKKTSWIPVETAAANAIKKIYLSV